MKDKLAQLFFSQAALATYQACPLKFRYRYWDGFGWMRGSMTEERQQERILGEQFHTLARRYFQGVDIESIERIIPQGVLVTWFANLRKRFPLQKDVKYYPEQELRLCVPSIRLIAKYDLLIARSDGHMVIYDWKTQTKPLEKSIRTLQSKIYQLMLCENSPAGQIQAENITMVLWNPRYPAEEQMLYYTDELYQQDRREIETCIASIKSKPYDAFYGIKPETAGATVPKDCHWCEYYGLCYEAEGLSLHIMRNTGWEDGIAWDDIEEISCSEAR
jgi:hypothetical protein